MGWFKLPLDVIWKHQMGERYWTWGSLIGQTFFIKIMLAILGSILSYRDAPLPIPTTFKDYLPFITLEGFILIMWIFGVANLLEIRPRRKRGVEYYSHYWGTPRFFPDKPIVHWLIIPLCSGLVAFGIYQLFHALGIYLFILAAIQFMDAVDCYRAKRIDKINRQDREILMGIKTAEMENERPPQLEIVRVASPLLQARLPEEIEQFEARWKKVLKSS